MDKVSVVMVMYLVDPRDAQEWVLPDSGNYEKVVGPMTTTQAQYFLTKTARELDSLADVTEHQLDIGAEVLTL